MPRVSKKRQMPRKPSDNPARDTEEMNKTAQTSLGNPKKSWMHTARLSAPPPQQDVEDQGKTKSTSQASVLPKSQQVEDVKHMSNTVVSDQTAAKQGTTLQQNIRISTASVITSNGLGNSSLNSPLLAENCNPLSAMRSKSSQAPSIANSPDMVDQNRTSNDSMFSITPTVDKNLKQSSSGESQSLLVHIDQDLRRLPRLLESCNGADSLERQVVDNKSIEIGAQLATPLVGPEESTAMRLSSNQPRLPSYRTSAESNSFPKSTKNNTFSTTNDTTAKLNKQQYANSAGVPNRRSFERAVTTSCANIKSDSSTPSKMKNTSSGIPPIGRQQNLRLDAQILQKNVPALLSLNEFVEASGQRAATMWTHLLARLQDKIDEVSTTANQTSRKASQTRWLNDLKLACTHREDEYLLMFQMSAIMQMPQARKLINNKGFSSGLECLRELFDDNDEGKSLWAVNFPCAYPHSELLLDHWLQTLYNDIYTIGVHMDALNKICSSLGRLPSMNEINTKWFPSRRIQMAVFRSLLARNWHPPLDGCFDKILRIFENGLNEEQNIEYIAPRTAILLTTRLDPVETEHGVVDIEVMACYRIHQTHLMSNSEMQFPNTVMFTSPNNTFGHSVRPRDWNNSSQQHSPLQTYSNVLPSLHQTMSSQQSCSAHHAPKASKSTQPRSKNKRQTVQQKPRSAIVPSRSSQPTQNDHNQWNSKQTRTVGPKGGNPSVMENHLAFPQTRSYPQASSRGNSFYQEHLRDPVSVPTSLTPKQHPYRAYVAEFFESTPLYFTSKETIRTMDFEVPKAAFAKLAIQSEDETGGPPRRAINSTIQIVRLRGAIIKPPNTFSEWYLAETSWPSNITVFLNDQPIEFRRKPLHAKDLAVDVTSRIRLGHNRLAASFLWGNAPLADFHFALALERVVIADNAVLSIEIKYGERSNTEEQLRRYFEQQSDSEVELMLDHLDISLLDPYTSKMPTIPVRTAHCMHFRCFDLDVFLQTRPLDINKADCFICPLCGKDARPGNLRVDGWVSQVLQKLKDNGQSGAKVIRVSPDLTWVVKEVIQTENDGGNMHLQQLVPKTDPHPRDVIELD